MTEYITNKQQLIAYFFDSCKPPQQWRIGTEHEKFLFDKNKVRLSYDKIKIILQNLRSDYFSEIVEAGNIIGLKGKNGDSLTLEPGGQFELSGAPLENIHQTCKETRDHLTSLRAVCDKIGVTPLGIGFDPITTIQDVPWMPKNRYQLMREYMPTKGELGTSMMTRSCTVQVNLDYSSEADMVKKMQVGFALQPLATALFANSSIVDGKATHYQSFRSELWKDTDPDRCGILDFIFDADMSFEKWVDYMLDVPMYFVYRDGVYHDVLGLSFKDFINGKLKGFEGQRPTIKDWEDHLTVAFPEVRMKGFIEMRGADTGGWDRLCALPSFWVGLLYDNDTLNTVHQYIKQFSPADILNARNEVTTAGFSTKMADKSLYEIARDIIALAETGLRNRNIKNIDGYDESKFLVPIQEVIANKKTYADIAKQILLEKGMDELFKEFAY